MGCLTSALVGHGVGCEPKRVWSRRSDEGTKIRPKPSAPEATAEQAVQDLRWHRRRHFSAEDKTWIVLEDLRREESIAELFRREAIAQNLY